MWERKLPRIKTGSLVGFATSAFLTVFSGNAVSEPDNSVAHWPLSHSSTVDAPSVGVEYNVIAETEDGARILAAVPAPQVPIIIERKSVTELPRLNPGMINVTAPSASFYRFLPDGHIFESPVQVQIPYDPTLILAGYTAADIRTYYFEPDKGKYVPLYRVEHADLKIASVTTHFTDMINAIIVRPEQPGVQGFNPNLIASVPAANPATNMTLVEPPQARQDGSASLNYPIVLPPARGNFKPQLALSYSSSRGYGGAGEGWEIDISRIEIDTRFGSPKYETENWLQSLPWERLNIPGLEDIIDQLYRPIDERYLLDGKALVPTKESAPCIEASSDGVLYKFRKKAASIELCDAAQSRLTTIGKSLTIAAPCLFMGMQQMQ